MAIKTVDKARKSGILKDPMTSSAAQAREENPSLESVVNRAIEVIGDKEEAYRWLGNPVAALEYATPISLAATREGSEKVLAVLSNLEHGVL